MSRPSAAVAWQRAGRPARQPGIWHDTSATRRLIAYEPLLNRVLDRQNEALLDNLLVPAPSCEKRRKWDP